MTTGIIVAMDKELSLLKPLIENRQTESAGGYKFITGTVGGKPVCVMKCGIGKVNAALGAATMINAYHLG